MRWLLCAHGIYWCVNNRTKCRTNSYGLERAKSKNAVASFRIDQQSFPRPDQLLSLLVFVAIEEFFNSTLEFTLVPIESGAVSGRMLSKIIAIVSDSMRVAPFIIFISRPMSAPVIGSSRWNRRKWKTNATAVKEQTEPVQRDKVTDILLEMFSILLDAGKRAVCFVPAK